MKIRPTQNQISRRKCAAATWSGMIVLSALAAVAGFRPVIAAPCQPLMPTITNRPPAAASLRSGAARPTRSLFRFYRDDRTPDQSTTVRIDAAHTADAAIHPFVFGNFIEHLGGVVYEGIWSQTLLNPNLEQIEERDTEPPAWQLGDGGRWIEGGYRSARCVRLLPPASDAAPHTKRITVFGNAPSDARYPASLAQTVRLPLHRTRRYHVSLFGRAPRGKACFMAALKDPEGRLYRARPQWVEGADWRPFRLALELPPAAAAAGPELRFVVWLQEGKAVDLDQIELFPDDSVDGLDPDVLKRTQEWHPPLLRWPGGNFASGYHWRDGIGPRDRRPTRRNAAWGGIEPNHFGTHEFMDFCRRVGAQPQLTVNAGDGTPEEAAAWVRYCNRPADDEYGKLRAANGSPSPFGVKTWEVGNELYGGWQIGHTDPAGNAARYVRFRDAMLAADPTLKLIATGKADEFTPDGLRRDFEWDRALLQAAVANNGPAPEWLSIHPLVPLPGIMKRSTYAEQYENAMAQPQFLGETLLPRLADLIREIAGPQARTRIAVTEWGIIIDGNEWQQSPNHDSLAGAIFNALTLNAILRNSDWVTLANMTALMHGGGIKKWNGVTYVDPQYYAQQLYTLAHPHTPVQTSTTGPGHDVPAHGGMPAVADVPDVDVVAALTQDRKALTVFAVNRHFSADRPLRLEVKGFAARSVSATMLTSPDPRDGNGWDHPETVRPRPFKVRPAVGEGALQATLPPHSLVVFTLHRP